MKKDNTLIILLIISAILALILILGNIFQPAKAEPPQDDTEIYATEPQPTVEEPPRETVSDDPESQIYMAAAMQSINWRLAVAISKLETGNWTSKAFVEGHNYGGLCSNGKPIEYASEKEGLEAYIRCLESYGADRPEEMQARYCPGSDTWTSQVRDIMENL